MSEIITVSSDDEVPPPKKLKATVLEIKQGLNEECVVLSDDEEILPVTNGHAGNSKINISEEPSTSTKHTESDSDIKDLFEEFVSCIENTHNLVRDKKEIVESKIPVLRKYYEHTPDYTKTEECKRMIEEQLTLARNDSEQCLIAFSNVYQTLKYEYNHKATYTNPENTRKIKKLDALLRRFRAKIRHLEETENDLNDLDDEDSAYIQLQRYKQKAAKVFDKLCEYVNEDPHYDHIIYKKLNFKKSKFPEFNKCINKKYKNNNLFPTFYEMDRLLRICAKDNKLDVSEGELSSEIKHCFRKVGELLQKRRRADLLDVHMGIIGSDKMEDPAAKDPQLNEALWSNRKTAESRIAQVVNEFVIKQENGEAPHLSCDSDDSHQKESDEESDCVIESI